MSKKEEQAKVTTDEGKDATKVEPTKAEPEVVTPKAETDKGKDESEETWEQKYKTLEGMYRKEKEKNTTFDTLLTEVRNVNSQVKQQGETLAIHTEILSSSAELSEEAQDRVKKARDAQEKQRAVYKELQETMDRIGKYAKAAGLELEHEALKPARDAFEAGKAKEALDLTIIACIGQKKETSVADVKSAEKETKETKPNLKSLRAASAPSKSVGDMTPLEKIKAGMEEAKRKQA